MIQRRIQAITRVDARATKASCEIFALKQRPAIDHNDPEFLSRGVGFEKRLFDDAALGVYEDDVASRGDLGGGGAGDDGVGEGDLFADEGVDGG